MTSHELARKLLTMPDVPVVYRCCSDWAEMTIDDIGLITAEQGRAAVEAEMQRCREWAAKERQFPEGEEPVYVTVVTFPGN